LYALFRGRFRLSNYNFCMDEACLEDKDVWRDTHLLVKLGLNCRMGPLKTQTSLMFIRYKKRSV